MLRIITGKENVQVVHWKSDSSKFFFLYVLLTVFLGIVLDNDQLDAHLLYFTIRLL